ncbi:MAG: type II toxin-antitoxin system RelE/ParE family toxin [Salinibacterium sp.]|nr:type II toxin-antitoxin system RelE/ParE family toxin [Salinibacterium sp.]
MTDSVEIVWSAQVLDDLVGIRDFIARTSPRYAELTARQIIESVERLAVFPDGACGAGAGRTLGPRSNPWRVSDHVRATSTVAHRSTHRLSGLAAISARRIAHGRSEGRSRSAR